MCFLKAQEVTQPYAPPAPPPDEKKKTVPEWMVRTVIEQRQKRRFAKFPRRSSQESALSDQGLLGAAKLGG